MSHSVSPALAAQWPLVAALRTTLPGTDSTHPARVVETHISWVFLAGGYAYKLKKAVDLGFVDFTTLALRRHYCEEELRLNRRLAPDLYLDVVAIGQRGATPFLMAKTRIARPPENGVGPHSPVAEGATPDSAAVEYAVRMREFPQDALASHALARGQLRNDHIDDLAARIADFHQRIAIASPGSDYGSPATIAATLLANFEEIEPVAQDLGEHAEVAALRAWMREKGVRPLPADTPGSALLALAMERQQQGFVRECHGDLHLGNIVLLDDRLVVFDCIEFNPRLRWIDVISEVAFLEMDLLDRGHPALAHRFLNAYLEHTGDYAGLSMLPLYRCYRAMVRAKVACLRIAQVPAAAERDEELAEYRGYLALARRFTRPPRPALVVTHGVSGTGKSTVTQALLEATGALRLRTDIERKRLHGIARRDRGAAGIDAGIYTPDATRKAYERVATLARAVLDAGEVAIVDATCLHRWQRDLFRALAAETGAPFAILSFTATEATLRQRLARRASEATDVSDADLAILEHQLRSQEALATDELGEVECWDSETRRADDPAAFASLLARLRITAQPS